MDFITLRTFDNSIETHILKSKLESEGIRCYIFDEHIVTMNPLFNQTVGGIKLRIAATDLERAQVILNQIDEVEVKSEDGTIVNCPKCGSNSYYSGYKSMKGTKGILSIVISFLFLVFPVYFKTLKKCKSCGHEFK